MLSFCHCHRAAPPVQHGVFGHRELQEGEAGNGRAVWNYKRYLCSECDGASLKLIAMYTVLLMITQAGPKMGPQ